MSAAVWAVIVFAVLAANLPFVNQRVLAVGPHRAGKSLAWRSAELLVFYLLVGGVSLSLEQSLGQIYPQRWEFFATTLALFVTLAFPGFVFRYLIRH
jgi:hypothetical protein